MTISDKYENELLKTIKEKGKYVQLHKGNPGEAGTSNVCTESKRKEITWNEPSSGSMSSSNAQQWTNVSTTEEVTHISIWTAAEGGDHVTYGALEEARSLTAGENFELPAGEVIQTID